VLGFALLAAGLVALVLSGRIAGPTARRTTQGVAVLAVVGGALALLRRPGSAWHLPGFGPRQWRQP
jgi:hypothetical protein